MRRSLLLLAAATTVGWPAALWLATHLVVLRVVAVPGPDRLPGVRVLHVSDVHVRERLGARERRLVELATAAAPDLIVVTGDVVEPAALPPSGNLGGAAALVGRLARVAPTAVVLGNNDLLPGRPGDAAPAGELAARLSEAGAVVLRNRSVRVEGTSGTAGLYLVGLDDNYTHHEDLLAALRGVPDGAPAILLAHSPDVVVDYDVSRFDLILAGHTHGGQIRLPYVGALETQTRVPYVEGLYRLPTGNWLHVSGGVGTSGVDLRFLAPPSITLLLPAGR